jgi:hypothetical protein
MASRFGRCNKNTIYRIVSQLVKKGWLVKTDGGERNSTGKFDSTIYKVLSHPHYAKLHPDSCSPVPESGQVSGEQAPKLHFKAGSPVPESGQDQSRFEQKPVPESGHSSVKASVVEAFVSKQGVTGVTCATENLSDELETDNYLQDEVRAPRSSDFGWSEEMAERIKQDLRSEPSFDRIWRGNGEWSTAGYEEPGKRDWGDLRMLGGLMVGSELERWETLFEILKETQLQYDVEDSGRLFSIATQTVRGAA